MQNGVGRRGFTMLEVILAIVIMGIVLSYFLLGTRTAMHANERSDVYSRALSATEQVWEELRLRTRSELDALSLPLLLWEPVAGDRGQGIRVNVVGIDQVQASEVPNAGGLMLHRLRRVTLETEYPGKDGSVRARRSSSIVYVHN